MWCNVGFAQCTKGDCRNGYGTYTWDIFTYVGEFKKGKKHGEWEIYHDNGLIDSKGNYKYGVENGLWGNWVSKKSI